MAEEIAMVVDVVKKGGSAWIHTNYTTLHTSHYHWTKADYTA